MTRIEPAPGRPIGAPRSIILRPARGHRRVVVTGPAPGEVLAEGVVETEVFSDGKLHHLRVRQADGCLFIAEPHRVRDAAPRPAALEMA